jgi:hypothetical protein
VASAVDLCFDDWTDLQRCSFISRQERGVKALLCATAKLRKAGRSLLRSQRMSQENLIGSTVMDKFVVVCSRPASMVPIPIHPAWRFEDLMTTTQ